MKKNLLLVLALLVAPLFMSSCSDDDDNPKLVSLDLKSFSLENGVETSGGKYWEGTFSETATLKSQIFTFSHTASAEYLSWDGFSVSNSTNNSNHGTEWINNQWGCMAKKGAKGANYIVASWSSYKDSPTNETFAEDKFSNWIKIYDGTDSYKAVSVSVCNSPWAYYNVLEGDAFANKFEEGDYFKLIIYGVGADNVIKGNPVEYYLADYRNNKKELTTTWTNVDLRSLGEIKYLVFQMETTDVGEWGPNTATYFCLDNLIVESIL